MILLIALIFVTFLIYNRIKSNMRRESEIMLKFSKASKSPLWRHKKEMRCFILVLSLLSLILSTTLTFSFAQTPEEELAAITQSIPQKWWEGGWDKMVELKDFISRYNDSPALCAQAQYYLACNYRIRGDLESALREYENLITTYPQITTECAKARFEIAQIYFHYLNDIPKAIAEYKKVITDYPDSLSAPMAQLGIARSYRRQQDHANALAEYQKVIDNYPQSNKQHIEAYMDMADIAEEQADINNALSYYRSAYLICPLDDTETKERITNAISNILNTKDIPMAQADEFIESLNNKKE